MGEVLTKEQGQDDSNDVPDDDSEELPDRPPPLPFSLDTAFNDRLLLELHHLQDLENDSIEEEVYEVFIFVDILNRTTLTGFAPLPL